MLGSELRSLRLRRELSLRQVAHDAGISPSTLAQFETGQKYPTLATLEGIAGALEIKFVIGPRETHLEETPGHY